MMEKQFTSHCQNLLSACGLAITSACFSLDLYASGFIISTGYEYSQGKYDYDDNTRQHSQFLALKWHTESWSVKISNSYMDSEGPAGISDNDSGLSQLSGTEDTRYKGWGDTRITMTRELNWDQAARQGIFLDLTAGVRLATAESSTGISDHDPDFDLVLDAYWSQPQWLTILSAGYRWSGHRHSISTKDAYMLAAGLQYQNKAQCKPGVIYDHRQSIYPGIAAINELMVYARCQLGSAWSVMPYALTGFSNNSLDNGGGIQLSMRY
ncbi:hypothetical protein [Oceanospirillum sediminis]|uniref:Uncharacterized protein n=1 Tax=Oceanospirillum sediminis TaxID=2760088 RepID=A0A839IXM6_9GAMM|nr:hypothetical protein [Oceanospirillum sediminis]MBB1489199.1 hypothetical protein [Oceanospirillum sediminis]